MGQVVRIVDVIGRERAAEHEERLKKIPKPTADAADEESATVGEVMPIKKLQPGDILDVVIKMRQFMASTETAAFTLYASFEELGNPVLEEEAQKARHTLELATTRIAALLSTIEKTPYYAELRRETLALRKTTPTTPKAGAKKDKKK